MGRPKLNQSEREKREKYNTRLSGEMRAKWIWLALLQADTQFPLVDAMVESLDASFKRERRKVGLSTVLTDEEVSDLLKKKFRN